MRMFVSEGGTTLTIVGLGLSLDSDWRLGTGLTVSPAVPALVMAEVAEGTETIAEYASILTMGPEATFVLIVDCELPGETLAVKGWNSLWQFHLLSLAVSAPCSSLYSIVRSLSGRSTYSLANREILFRPPPPAVATPEELGWATEHQPAFQSLILSPAFSRAMRAYGNSQYLPDRDLRMMLLWSGIEGLLGVDAELTRRIALYSALLLNGSAKERSSYFAKVKGAYSLRSKAVHGVGLSPEKLEEGCHLASEILVGLLRRCVELGRVPLPSELDSVALSANIQA